MTSRWVCWFGAIGAIGTLVACGESAAPTSAEPSPVTIAPGGESVDATPAPAASTTSVEASTPGYTIVADLRELDAPGERVLLDQYATAIADGPLVGPDGRRYGNDVMAEDGTLVEMMDFIGVSDPNDPDQTIVGFLSSDWRGPTPQVLADHLADVPVFGFGGDEIGHFERAFHKAGENGAEEDYYTQEFVPNV